MREFTRQAPAVFLIVASALIFGGCQSGDEAPAAEAPEAAPELQVLDVVATTSSLCFLVEELALDLAECEVLSEDAESFRPAPEQIVDIGNASLIVVNGLGMEKWLEGASLPASRVIEASATVDPIELETVTHSHGPEGEHSHRGTDPYVWMDPLALASQAEQIAAALARALPEHAPTIEQRRSDMVASLGALAAESRYRVLAAAGLSENEEFRFEFATLSPRFSYLARALGADLSSFVADEGEGAELSGHDLRHLESWLGRARFPVVLESAGVSTSGDGTGSPVSRQVAALDGTGLLLVELDDLSGSRPEAPEGAGDYVARFRENVSRIEAALSAAVE